MGRTNTITNLLFALGPIALGILVAMIAGFNRFQGLLFALALATTSLAALVLLKLPMLRQGRFFAFGPNQAGEGKRWLWWLAFALLCFAVLVGVVAARPQ
jgi:hypothetical protein